MLGAFGGHSDLYAGGLFRGVDLIFGDPAGIQCQAIGVRVQNGYSFTIGQTGVPTGKYVAFFGDYRIHAGSDVGIVALHQVIVRYATVDIIQDVAVITGSGTAVNAVEVHVGIAAATAKFTGGVLTVGLTPQHKGIDQLVAGGAVGDGRMENAVIIGCPGLTHVVGEQDQGIQLVLGQGHAIAVSKLIDRFFEGGGMLFQHLLALFFGDGVLFIIRNLIIRAKGTIADGIMVVIPIRLFLKTLVFL